MDDEIQSLSDLERLNYKRQEADYCIHHPLEAETHFENKKHEEYVSHLEREHKEDAEVSPDDDY